MTLCKEVSLAQAVIEQSERLVEKADLKHLALAKRAHRRARFGKCLHLLAGAFALLSATSITAVISDLTNSMVVKIFSAALGFLSGIITLAIPLYFDEKETQHMFEGATKFLKLREESRGVGKRPNTTEKQAYTALEELQKEYGKLSSDFDAFLPSSFYKGKGKSSAPSSHGEEIKRT
jgi:hypothetical protein